MIHCSHRCRLVSLLAAMLFATSPAFAQEKSVNPGINDSYKDPSPAEFVKRFETESREIFANRDRIVEACGVKHGIVVADVGAGTGLFTRLFAKEVGADGKVYAVDIAANFIEHIAKTSKERGINNVEAIVCTADSAKLPENSTDLAFICDVYHHFEFPHKTMTSIHRALRPGGRVVVIDFHRIEGVSSDWILSHVRVGQDVFRWEIESAGFKLVGEPKFLKENYFMIFEKVEAPKARPSDAGASEGR